MSFLVYVIEGVVVVVAVVVVVVVAVVAVVVCREQFIVFSGQSIVVS